MSFTWNRIGFNMPRCGKCGQKLKVGQTVKFVGDGVYEHLDCPREPLAAAQDVMRRWSSNQPVKIDDLVAAARVIINKFEDAEETDRG